MKLRIQQPDPAITTPADDTNTRDLAARNLQRQSGDRYRNTTYQHKHSKMEQETAKPRILQLQQKYISQEAAQNQIAIWTPQGGHATPPRQNGHTQQDSTETRRGNQK